MAITVPTGERRAQSAPLPGPRFDVPAGGDNAVARGIDKVADAVGRIQDDERRKADQIAVLEADKQATAAETQLLYGDGGVLTKRGKEAFATPEAALGAFDSKVAEISQGLTNRDQQMAFRRAAQVRRDNIDRTVQRHVAGERQAYDNEQTEGFLVNETNAAIAAAGDQQRVQMGLDRTTAALIDYGTRNGKSPEWVQQQVAERQGKIHTGVIDRFLAAQQDLTAKAYYDEHKDQIPGSERVRLERALEIGSVRGESQRQADAIVRDNKDLKGALEAARQIKDPHVRDETTTRIKDYFATLKQADELRRDDAYRQAATSLEQNGGDLDRVSPGTLALIDDPARRHALETRSRQIRQGVEPVTNYERYYDLMNLASSDGTRAQFTKTDLMQYRHELSDADFKHMVSVQSQLRQGKQIDEALEGYRTKKQIVDSALTAAGIDATPKQGTSDSQRVYAFQKAVDDRILDLQTRTGKKATTEEVQGIVDDLLIKGKVDGTWFSRKRVYELGPGEDLVLKPSDVPAAERVKIEAALRSQRLPVTDQSVLDLYRAKIMRKKPAPAGGAIGAPP